MMVTWEQGKDAGLVMTRIALESTAATSGILERATRSWSPLHRLGLNRLIGRPQPFHTGHRRRRQHAIRLNVMERRRSSDASRRTISPGTLNHPQTRSHFWRDTWYCG